MDQWFDSAEGLRSLLAAIGYGMSITQLSQGELRGRFQLAGSPLVPVLSITTDQMLVFEGDRKAGWLPFCINTRGRHAAGPWQNHAQQLASWILQ